MKCKPVDSEIISISSTSFNNTGLETIESYILHPYKNGIVYTGRSISTVD